MGLSTLALAGVAVGLFAFARSFGKHNILTLFFISFYKTRFRINIALFLYHSATLQFQLIHHRKQLETRNGRRQQKKCSALKIQIRFLEFLRSRLGRIKKMIFNLKIWSSIKQTVISEIMKISS